MVYIVLVVFLLTRLVNLLKFPIFADEAIYVRWAQIMWHDASQRFMPLADGKPPLHMWLMIPYLKIISDPLLAGRLFSVTCGLFSLIGIWFLTRELFNKKAANWAAIFYTLLPFSLTYDRMALTDMPLIMFMIWFLFFLIRFVREPKLDLAMITGILLGLSLLTKPTALFFFAFLPCSLLVSDFRKKKKVGYFKLTFYFLVIVVFSVAIYGILILSPLFRFIYSRSREYSFTLGEFLQSPIYTIKLTLGKIIPWSFAYYTFSVMILFLGGNIYGLKKKNSAILFLLSIFYIQLIINMVFGKVIYPRYYLVFLPAIVPVASFVMTVFTEKLAPKLKGLLLLIIFAPSIYFAYFYIFRPLETPFVEADREQYLTSWSAGIGIREIAKFFRNHPNKDKVYVVSEGFFGTLPDGLAIYLNNYGISVEGVGVPVVGIPEEIFKKQKEGYKTYMVVNSTRAKFKDPRAKAIKEFEKPAKENGEREKLILFEVGK